VSAGLRPPPDVARLRALADETRIHAHAARLAAEGKRFAMVTVVRTAGSTPRKPGAKMLVAENGEQYGTVGGGRIEAELLDEAKRAMAEGTPRLVRRHLTRELAMCCGGEVEAFVDPSARRETLVLVGGGHIHRALANVGAEMELDVVVVDDLEELASVERFPRATRLVHSWLPKEWGVTLDETAYVVVATRDHEVDQEVLEKLATMGAEPRYVGVVGSRAKLLRFKKRLETKGIEPAWIERINGPIGVDVGAETPAEIAVAIAAEIVQVRRRGTPATWGEGGRKS
jgi:xanthine dehydrogenase accessory factor